MKKVIAFLLSTAILFALSACAARTNTTDTTSITDSEVPTLSDSSTIFPSAATETTMSYTPTEPDLRSADEMMQEPLYTGEPAQFPASTELPKGVKSVKFTDWGEYAVKYLPDVVYDNREGEELVIQILMPLDAAAMMGAPSETRYPLIVYIPGSAWMRQNVYMSLPEMMRVCERGYAVAIVEYRGTDVAPFPAQTEDAKTAIRFMKNNAEVYGIDPDKIAIWGNSSGGHTSVMAGITGDGLLDNSTYSDFSSEVQCIIDWYGPTDTTLMNYYPSMMDHRASNSPEGLLIGGVDVLENPELAQKTNPLNYLSAEKSIPPILIMHGSGDILVPFNQSVRLYEKLKALDKTVEMYKLEDASHGTGGFVSDEALNLVLQFFERHIS